MSAPYQLFTWNFSYFSAKARAYLRYKQYHCGLPFEEILATREIVGGLLIPSTGSNVVPQVRTPEGTWIQDTSEIIDELEARFPDAPVIPSTPRQRLVSYLLELLADEWMLPWGFWERWYYSLGDVEPNHEAFNALQWGRMFNPAGNGEARMASAREVFRNAMRIDAPHEAVFGPYAGLVQLGVTEETIDAWTASMHNMLAILEAHFNDHDYVLGGVPTLADFALLGPLYPHLYKDPVPGFMMRTQYPLVSEWIERTNGSTEAGYGSYREPRYSLVEGELVQNAAGTLLPDDEIPATLLPLLAVFFTEMWPVMTATVDVLTAFIANNDVNPGDELPGKSFYSPQQFAELQSGEGKLTLPFRLGDVAGTRMASPYHVWMLQRLADATLGDVVASFKDLLSPVGGTGLLSLDTMLAGCRVEKRFEQIFVQ